MSHILTVDFLHPKWTNCHTYHTEVNNNNDDNNNNNFSCQEGFQLRMEDEPSLSAWTKRLVNTSLSQFMTKHTIMLSYLYNLMQHLMFIIKWHLLNEN